MFTAVLLPFNLALADTDQQGDGGVGILQQTASETLNPAGFKKPTAVIARGINALMAFIGSISLVLYIWAGILWMSSAGNAERVTKAKQIMLWTTLGVAVMLGSYVIVTFVFDIFS